MILGTTPIEMAAYRVLKALDEYGTRVPASAEDLRVGAGLTVGALGEAIDLLVEMECIAVLRLIGSSEYGFVSARLLPRGRLTFQQSQLSHEGAREPAGTAHTHSEKNGIGGNSVSEVTRRNIRDALTLSGMAWAGRLGEADFLSRIFDLDSIPSHDHRFEHVSGDIGQHRVNNSDWDDDWVFTDSRFNLMKGPDDRFLQFLCETIHPVVRSDDSAANTLLGIYNQHLAADGWEIAEGTVLSGRPVYVARRKPALGIEKGLTERLSRRVDTSYVANQVTRMNSAVDRRDFELAIGTAKELLETICKTILLDRGVHPDTGWDFPKLVREAGRILPLAPATVKTQGKGIEALRVLLSSITTAAEKVGQLRSLYGTGHGKEADTVALDGHHAQFIAAVSAALGIFLFESHMIGGGRGKK